MVFDAQYVFGPATRLQTQAIGEPGHRTFRIMVESDDGRAAALWVEKEQLQALGLAVEQLLAEFQGGAAAKPPRQPPAETFPPNPTVDFKVGRLALGQDESELETGARYVLLVYDLEGSTSEEEEPNQPATFAGGAAAVLSTLTSLGLPTGGVSIVDGSGFSRSDHITPVLLASLHALSRGREPSGRGLG